jgi:GTPase SAR1 family protein
MKELEKHAKEDVNMVLVGNKCDLASKRAVKFEEAEVNYSFLKPLSNIQLQKGR